MLPVIYIPLWFNIILFMSGLTLISISFYLLSNKKCRWFIIVPVFAYGLHFAVFYGFITFAQLTSHVLDAETMTLWSAVLRFQGIITAISMIFIIHVTWGKKKNEQYKP